jgi:hypothetical protein
MPDTSNSDKLTVKLGEMTNKLRSREVLTQSQHRLAETYRHITELQAQGNLTDTELAKQEANLERLASLVAGLRTKSADIKALLRSELQARHQLEMDGVFLEEKRKDNQEKNNEDNEEEQS